MSHRSRLWAQAVLMIVLLMSLTLVAAQDAAAPEPVGLRPDAPPYALHGPYWVGYQTLMTRYADYALQVAAWYPATNPEAFEESVTYPAVSSKWEGIPLEVQVSSQGHALDQALPDVRGAPYPLVILSHGFANQPWAYSYQGEHLASHGFIVLAPNHLESLDANYSAIGMASIRRLTDVQHTILYSEKLTAEEGPLAGLIDTDQIAVVGYSFGGFTALLAAGGQLNFEALRSACVVLPEDHPIGVLCPSLLGSEEGMAALAGLEAVPKGLWAGWDEPRIRAIISAGGETELLGADGLASITIPVMVMNGSGVQALPSEWSSGATWDQVSSTQKVMVVLREANHCIFAEGCDHFTWPLRIGWYAGCADPVWDMNRAHDLINHFTTAFLRDMLTGDILAHAALAVDAVDFAGVTYQAEGF